MVVKILYLQKKLMKWHLIWIAKFLYYFLRAFYSCDILFTMEYGINLMLPHNGLGVVINPKTILGNNIKIHQNVTIGGREGSGAPIVEDDVLLGAGCCILGAITIHKGASVGANAVVITDVPEGCIAVGIPAVIKERKIKK